MPTSRRRVVTHPNAIPPVAHWSSTMAASRRITGCDATRAIAVAHCRRPSRTLSAMSRGRRLGALVLLVAAISALLAGCFTGKRPHFDDAEPVNTAASGDPNIDAVLQRL